jgi:polar amino acid transport system substrate-binding protein
VRAWRKHAAFWAFLLAILPAQAAETTAATTAEPPLAPTGTLRAVYIVTNLAQATRDPATGAITGVIADIARDLGRRAGVPVAITPVQTAADVLAAVQAHQADIGFVAPNPARQGVVLYSQTYMLVQQTLVVPDGSPIMTVKDIDQPGRTIGANTDDSVSTWLKARLQFAKIRETPDYTLKEAATWFNQGAIAAFAGNRQRLRAAIQDKTGLHLLPDSLYGVPQAIAIPLDRPDLLKTINAELDAMRASGFLAAAMRNSGVEGIEVAPGP